MEYYILILQHVPPSLFIHRLSIAPYLLVALFLAVHSFPVHVLDCIYTLLEQSCSWLVFVTTFTLDVANE